MNYYQILGLQPNANKEEIKKQFRKLSMQYHPDRNKDPGATKKFQEINEAFSALSNQSSIPQNPFNMFDKSAMNANNAADDLFSHLFKHMAEDINMQVFTASLEDEDFLNNIGNLNNMSFPFPIPIPNLFSKINNNNASYNLGSKMNSNLFKNKMYKEFSIEPIHHELVINLQQSYTGDNVPIKIERTICEYNKKREETETIYINIQKGVDDGEIIYVKEKGNIVNNKKGDINITIKIINETEFKRDGLNLTIIKNVPFKNAFCGFHFSIEHVNGKTYKLHNKAGNVIKPDSSKIIPKLGMNREETIGNLIIKFNIIYPDQINNEQLNIIEKYF